MNGLELEIKYYYETGQCFKSEKIGLWHGHKPFLFVDNPGLKYVTVADRILFTQEEYNAFFHGITHVRDILIGVVNQ